ncbi:MAG: hypothetical protein WCI27_10940, partial [Candidatus Omnitrophota bacterium]
MIMKKGGRTLLIFLALIIVILVAGISISQFLLQNETQLRQAAEKTVVTLTASNSKISADLKESRKEIDVLEAKKKDIEDRVNSLLEEMDLEKALNEKLKVDNKKLRDDVDVAMRNKMEMRQKLIKELEAVQSRLREAEGKFSGQETELSATQQKIAGLEKLNNELEKKLAQKIKVVPPPPAPPAQEKVELARIVVTPEMAREGRVLNVDAETEFLIFDLGLNHGIKQGDIMSVYRGKVYLGDVRVSRVQDEMS